MLKFVKCGVLGAVAVAMVIGTTGCSGGRGGRSGRLVTVGDESGIMNVKQITTDATVEVAPTWSTDGRSVIFATDRFGGVSICKMDCSGGGGVTQITNPPSEMDGDYWPDANRKTGEICFASTRSRGVYQVFSISPGLGGLTQLTSMPQGAGSPSWSPDGKQIAFTSWDKKNKVYVWVMTIDGSNLRQVAEGCDPRWSPDGGRLVFTRLSDTRTAKGEKGKYWHIFYCNVDGSGVTQITSEDTNDIDPDWSPDGNWIAFTSSKQRITYGVYDPKNILDFSKYRYNIWIKNIDTAGRAATQLTNTSGSDWHPRWSPDGKTIVFCSDRQRSFDIWSMEPRVIGQIKPVQ